MPVKKGCITRERKIELLLRLGRIDGQVKGIKKMLEEDRYCVDILQQLSSIFEALRGVSKVIMRNYLELCATDAMQSKQTKRQEQIYNELMDIIYKFAK